jgi:hypothetical protein
VGFRRFCQNTVLFCAFLAAFCALSAYAQTTATSGESQVGVTGCAVNANSADFDTMAQCNASSGTGTFQKAPLFIGAVTSPPYSATTCGSSKAGMIQYTGGNLELCNGIAWTNLLTNGGTSTLSLGTSLTALNPTRSGDTTTGLYSANAGEVDVAGSGVQTAAFTGTGITINGQAAQAISLFRETTASTAGNNLTVQAGGAVSLGTNLSGGNLVLASGISTGTGSSNIQFNTYNSGSTGTSDNSATTALTLSATGATGTNEVTTLQANAGIGTNQNGGNLTLASGVSTGTGASSINFNVYGAGSTGSTANSATTAMTIGTNGYVGIGTTSPAAALDVYTSAGIGAIDLGGVNGISVPSTDSTSIAVGSSALAGLTTAGAYNDVALGYQAFKSGTGSSDTAVGYQALYNGGGGNSVAVGAQALLTVASGAGKNNAIGMQALEYVSSNGHNNAFGYQALRNATGASNTAMGDSTLLNVSSGSQNTAIGYTVGQTLTTGVSNILIGIGTGGISGGADVPLGSTNYFLNIGNTIEGSMSNANAIGRETLYLNSVASSVNYVSLSGGATGTGPTIAAGGGDSNVALNLTTLGTGALNLNTAGSGNIVLTPGSGNTLITTGSVGIGTTGPLATLDVAGSIYARSTNAGSGTTINWATSNTQYTTASCGAFSFTGMQDGGSYTLAVEGTTSGTCSFSNSDSPTLTFKLPSNHGATTAGTMTLYTFLRTGTYVFVTWMPGY